MTMRAHIHGAAWIVPVIAGMAGASLAGRPVATARRDDNQARQSNLSDLFVMNTDGTEQTALAALEFLIEIEATAVLE